MCLGLTFIYKLLYMRMLYVCMFFYALCKDNKRGNNVTYGKKRKKETYVKKKAFGQFGLVKMELVFRHVQK